MAKSTEEVENADAEAYQQNWADQYNTWQSNASAQADSYENNVEQFVQNLIDDGVLDEDEFDDIDASEARGEFESGVSGISQEEWENIAEEKRGADDYAEWARRYAQETGSE